VSDADAYHLALARIPDQARRVLSAMSPRVGASWPGRWWTKQALAQTVGGSPHAMSARMSELRRLGFVVEKHHAGDGLYLYRLARPPAAEPSLVSPMGDLNA
jgi:hypothetical protein